MRMSKPLICQSPGILSGIPVFAGTRVPVSTLIEYIEPGARLEEFLKDFPTVIRRQAVAVLELAKHVLCEHASPA